MTLSRRAQTMGEGENEGMWGSGARPEGSGEGLRWQEKRGWEIPPASGLESPDPDRNTPTLALS